MYKNFNIIYSNIVENKFDSFIIYMSENCRYNDSWIYAEDLIVSNYIDDTKKFIREVRKNIESKLKSWIIWQIDLSNDFIYETKLVIFIRSYNITCKCIVWKQENIITIEDIYIRN